MGASKIEQMQSPRTRQEYRLRAGLEQSNLLEMPEDDFHKLISEAENEPLFRKLRRTDGIIRFQRFPKTDISSSFLQLNEEVVADKGSFDVDTLLLNKEHVVHQVQRLGVERFKRYFLYPESDTSVDDIARDCDLTVSEVRRINSLIDEFALLSQFYNPSALSPEPGIRYSKVASVERGAGGLLIGYSSPFLARGRYSIDYERFEELQRDGTLGETEVREAKRLFRRLELINTQKDSMTRILLGIVEKQVLYLESGDEKALLPFTQRRLAQRLELAPSTISRAIRGRSIDTPWGEEKPLRQFFPRTRIFKRELVKGLLETEKDPTSDEAIKGKLREQYGVAISRRSVSNLRNELKIASARHRQRALSMAAQKGVSDGPN